MGPKVRAFWRNLAQQLLARLALVPLGVAQPLMGIVLALLLITLGCPVQAQPSPDTGSRALAYFRDVKLACPGLDTTDVAAIAGCAEKSCGRDDLADKTRAQACQYLAVAEGEHSHWANVAANAFGGLAYFGLVDFSAAARDYMASRIDALQALSDSGESAADVQRRATAERAMLALRDAISKDPGAARYLQDPSLWMGGVLDWDYAAASYAFRGLGHLETGDLAGAIDDYYSARVKTVHCGDAIPSEVMDPDIVIAELERRIYENPGSSSTDLRAGLKDRIQTDLHVRLCPSSWLDPEALKFRCCRLV